MNATTTNGQKPVYNGIGFDEQKPEKNREHWLNPSWATIGKMVIIIALFLGIFFYFENKTETNKMLIEQTKKAYEAKQLEITSVTAEKKQDGITEREKSKSSLERAKIIRKGIIRDLPVVKDTTREYKHKSLKKLANGKMGI